mmetsp:Transcript_65161/g.141435  ORF Transcript_65161/g.141435 Transcript_65161/m.141435 type:complete len:287 (-) Transcript_65161:541-1401(-)
MPASTKTQKQQLKTKKKPAADSKDTKSANKNATKNAKKSTKPSREWKGFECKERAPDYVVIKNGLTDEMLEKLEEVLQGKTPQPAKMKNENSGESDDERKERYDDRDSLVSWFTPKDDCPWLYDRLNDIAKHVANVEWDLLQVDAQGNLDCEWEQTQYSVYKTKQHFQAWHQDAFAEGTDPEDARVFSIVVMLTDPAEYKGGFFEAKVKVPGQKKKVLKKMKLDRGDTLVFPAKSLPHRVTKVISGTRRTLVTWVFNRNSCVYHTIGEGKGSTVGSGILGSADEAR